MSDYNRAVPTGLTCYDCKGALDSTVRNGWATMVHRDGEQDHPVRYQVTAKSWVLSSNQARRARREAIAEEVMAQRD